MKSSDTSTSVATTGVGLRLDSPPPEWFLAKVTAATTSGGFNVYSLEEVEPVPTTYGYQTKPGGFTTSYAAELNDATVAVNTIVFARFRSYRDSVGETYEFVVAGGGGGGLTHHTWSSYGGGITPVSGTSQDVFSDPGSPLAQSITGPSIPDGATVKGIVSMLCSAGNQFITLPLITSNMELEVLGGSMSIGGDGDDIGDFSSGIDVFFSPYVMFNDGVSYFLSINSTTLTARFHFINSSGSAQDITFSLNGSSRSGSLTQGYFDSLPRIQHVACYYTLEQ